MSCVPSDCINETLGLPTSKGSDSSNCWGRWRDEWRGEYDVLVLEALLLPLLASTSRRRSITSSWSDSCDGEPSEVTELLAELTSIGVSSRRRDERIVAFLPSPALTFAAFFDAALALETFAGGEVFLATAFPDCWRVLEGLVDAIVIGRVVIFFSGRMSANGKNNSSVEE